MRGSSCCPRLPSLGYLHPAIVRVPSWCPCSWCWCLLGDNTGCTTISSSITWRQQNKRRKSCSESNSFTQLTQKRGKERRLHPYPSTPVLHQIIPAYDTDETRRVTVYSVRYSKQQGDIISTCSRTSTIHSSCRSIRIICCWYTRCCCTYHKPKQFHKIPNRFEEYTITMSDPIPLTETSVFPWEY